MGVLLGNQKISKLDNFKTNMLPADYLSLPTILFVPVNDDHFLSMSQGFPGVVSWSGPGSDSTIGTLKTYLINLIYQNIIKPYMFVQQQYDQFRNKDFLHSCNIFLKNF